MFCNLFLNFVKNWKWNCKCLLFCFIFLNNRFLCEIHIVSHVEIYPWKTLPFYFHTKECHRVDYRNDRVSVNRANFLFLVRREPSTFKMNLKVEVFSKADWELFPCNSALTTHVKWNCSLELKVVHKL